MKKVTLLLVMVLVFCGSTLGASKNIVVRLGSNVINVNGKQYTLPQPVFRNDAGIMVPLELVTEGFDTTGLCLKDDLLTIMLGDQPEISFISDKDKGLQKLLTLIDQAKHYIYVQMYEFNNQDIIKRIIKARDRKVKVLVILDENSENVKSNVIKQISDNKNCYVHNIKKTGRYVYHKKIAIFDGNTVFTGSSNWTNAGFDMNKNDEQNFIIKSESLGYQMKESFLNEWDPKRKKDSVPVQTPCP